MAGTASPRLFVGVALPEDVRCALRDALRSQHALFPSAPALRWVAPEQWHLTLQFLGAVASERRDAVFAACAQAARSCARFDLQLDAPGAFRSPHTASVVWQVLRFASPSGYGAGIWLRGRGGRAKSYSPYFELAPRGHGAKEQARPGTDLRTVVLSVDAGAAQLAALAHAVMAQTVPLGFERETRTYHPHLTLARLKQPCDLREPLARVQLPPQRWTVPDVVLFRSTLGRDGARYDVLERCALAETAASD